MEGMRLGRGNAIGYKEDSSSFNRVKLWWKENDRWRGGSWVEGRRGGGWVEGKRMGRGEVG